MRLQRDDYQRYRCDRVDLSVPANSDEGGCGGYPSAKIWFAFPRNYHRAGVDDLGNVCGDSLSSRRAGLQRLANPGGDARIKRGAGVSGLPDGYLE